MRKNSPVVVKDVSCVYYILICLILKMYMFGSQI